jgi:hypothetical protein
MGRFPNDARARKLRKTRQKSRQFHLRLSRNLGEDARVLGVAAAARKHRVAQATASYHLKKQQQPGFRNGPWGGYRFVFMLGQQTKTH